MIAHEALQSHIYREELGMFRTVAAFQMIYYTLGTCTLYSSVWISEGWYRVRLNSFLLIRSISHFQIVSKWHQTHNTQFINDTYINHGTSIKSHFEDVFFTGVLICGRPLLFHYVSKAVSVECLDCPSALPITGVDLGHTSCLSGDCS